MVVKINLRVKVLVTDQYIQHKSNQNSYRL